MADETTPHDPTTTAAVATHNRSKVYVDGLDGVRVPFIEVALADSPARNGATPNVAVRLYDTSGPGSVPTVAVLVSLLVCLIPTTIGGLLSAIGIAGMDRVMQHNVLAMSGKAVEAAGDVSTLLLDKTGTITLGTRRMAAF